MCVSLNYSRLRFNLGGAEFPPDQDILVLIKVADENLYKAKENG